jgi:hypothetical protein
MKSGLVADRAHRLAAYGDMTASAARDVTTALLTGDSSAVRDAGRGLLLTLPSRVQAYAYDLYAVGGFTVNDGKLEFVLDPGSRWTYEDVCGAERENVRSHTIHPGFA